MLSQHTLSFIAIFMINELLRSFEIVIQDDIWKPFDFQDGYQ